MLNLGQMKKTNLKIFVLPSLGLIEFRNYIERNYPNFSIIYLNFEYNKQMDKWRIIVDMKPEPLSFFIVSLRSVWLSPEAFVIEHDKLKNFINNVDERPF